MSIVFVCNTKLEIVWVDGTFCEVIDCTHHPTLGHTLFEFLNVPIADPFRDEVAKLGSQTKRATYNTNLRQPSGQTVDYDISVEPVPSFKGVRDASLIAVGIRPRLSALVGAGLSVVDNGSHNGDPMRSTYRYSNLRLEDGVKLFRKLESHIETNHSYRSQAFTLEVASAALETNALYLSQAINFFSGLSFPNYLNQKRLDDLRIQVLAMPDGDFRSQWTAAGFGSYSTLNRYLKNRYGISPSQFRTRLRDLVEE